MMNRMVLPPLKKNAGGRLLFRLFHLSHKPGLFSGATNAQAGEPGHSDVSRASHPVRPATAPLEKSFGKWEQSFSRRRNRFANGSSRFSGGKVTLQMGAVIFPAEKSPGKFAK
jgi:hypothetical protein